MTRSQRDALVLNLCEAGLVSASDKLIEAMSITDEDSALDALKEIVKVYERAFAKSPPSPMSNLATDLRGLADDIDVLTGDNTK